MRRTVSNPILFPGCSGASILPLRRRTRNCSSVLRKSRSQWRENKQSLAQYTWVEQVTISLKGEQKKQEHFQVRLGPDGKPQKTSLDPPPEPPSGGGLKKHIVERKRKSTKSTPSR